MRGVLDRYAARNANSVLGVSDRIAVVAAQRAAKDTGNQPRRCTRMPSAAGLVSVIVAVLLAGASAYAHHSYGATYDTSKEIKLEGKLVQFVYRNPHSFVHVQAPDGDGVMHRWSVEWAGTSQLDNTGVKRESLKVGDQVVIMGRPSRVTGEYRALMVSLKRPSDGFTWGGRAGEVVD